MSKEMEAARELVRHIVCGVMCLPEEMDMCEENAGRCFQRMVGVTDKILALDCIGVIASEQDNFDYSDINMDIRIENSYLNERGWRKLVGADVEKGG